MKTIVIPLILKKMEQMIKEENVKSTDLLQPTQSSRKSLDKRRKWKKVAEICLKIQRNLDG